MESWSQGVPDWKKEVEEKTQGQKKTDGDKCHGREASTTFLRSHGPWLKDLPTWPTFSASFAATEQWAPPDPQSHQTHCHTLNVTFPFRPGMFLLLLSC